MPCLALTRPFLIRPLLALVLVAGCQIGTPASDPDAPVTPNAVAGEAIEVTALDAPPPAPGPEAALAPGSEATAPVQSAPPAAEPEAETAVEPTPAPQPEADAEPETPPVQKSAQQLACEKRGGTWASGPNGGLRTCVLATRDGGKKCNRESQCDGVCLARSGTCSPVKPLLGCNEILQDNGARVTLCIE